MQGLTKCRIPDCNALFASESQRFRHEQSCGVTMETTQLSSSLAYRPGNFAVQPFRIDTQFASNTVETDSDESCPMICTPDNSRAPSLCDPFERRLSGVVRTAARRDHGESSTPESERRQSGSGEPKRLKKQKREKQNRLEHASVLCRQEDFLRNYCGWERREQSGGNGNGAGLQANKSTVMRGCEDLLYWLVHREYCRALAEGTLDEMQQEMSEVLDNAPNGRPYAGTFLDPGNEPVCGHADSKSKECVAHGHSDWRECRRCYSDQRFRVAENNSIQSLERQRVQQENYLRSRASQSRPGSSSTQRRGLTR